MEEASVELIDSLAMMHVGRPALAGRDDGPDAPAPERRAGHRATT